MHPTPTRLASRYIDPRAARASYWKHGRMSPGLQRARARFRGPNALTGALLFVFVGGVFVYALKAVRQDETLGAADEEVVEARRRAAVAEMGRMSVEEERRAMELAAGVVSGGGGKGAGGEGGPGTQGRGDAPPPTPPPVPSRWRSFVGYVWPRGSDTKSSRSE